MPQNKFLIHELSHEHQALISEYINNFNKNDSRIKNIVKESKDTNEIFHKLSKINTTLAISFIKEFPFEALENGNQIIEALFATINNTELWSDSAWLNIIKNYQTYYEEQLDTKRKILFNKILPNLLKSMYPKNFKIFDIIDELITNNISEDFDNYFKKNQGYCAIRHTINPGNEINNFSIYNLNLNETMKEEMKDLIEKQKKKIINDLKTEITKHNSALSKMKKYQTFFRNIENTFNILNQEIQKINIDFKRKMNSFLKENKMEDLWIKKTNFFASTKQNKIYESDLPHINFQFIWNKRKVIDFYLKNQSFLDKHPSLLNQLINLEYAFDKNQEDFKNFTNTILETIKDEKVKADEYKSFYRKVLASSKLQSEPLLKDENHNKLVDTFHSNYKQNIELDCLLLKNNSKLEPYELEINNTQSSDNTNPINVPKEETELNDKPKEKIKTKGKTDITIFNRHNQDSKNKSKSKNKKSKIENKNNMEPDNKEKQTVQPIIKSDDKVTIYYNEIEKKPDQILMQTKPEEKNNSKPRQLGVKPRPITPKIPPELLQANFQKFIIYNLKRNTELDHEDGSPGLYVGFNEKTQKHQVIRGTSQIKKNNNNCLLLSNLKKQTYFNPEEIYEVNAEDIRDFWLKEKTNKPIDFLNLADNKEEIEKFKEKLQQLNNKTTPDTTWDNQTVENSNKKQKVESNGEEYKFLHKPIVY